MNRLLFLCVALILPCLAVACGLGNAEDKTNIPAGSTWINPKDGSVYVYVPEGKFIMGEAKHIRTVRTESFWIKQTEVTHGEYARCVAAGRCTSARDTPVNTADGTNHPVTGITWNQAVQYAAWIGGHLPSDAQWEKACRGTDGRTYPWGDNPPEEGLVNLDADFEGTTTVGSFPAGASPYGAMDMVGNVQEWTETPYYDRSHVLRVVRGGKWMDFENGTPCAVSWSRSPDLSDNFIGFRVVLFR